VKLEHEWKGWLAERGFAIPRGVFVSADAGADGLGAATRGLRPPLVAKALSPAVVHKTELGAVRLGIHDPASLLAALAEMRAALERHGVGPIAGLLVEEMAEPGVELLLGVVTDPTFGRLLAFGQGGTRVESLGEVSFFALPLRPFDVATVLGALPWLAPTIQRVGEDGVRALREAIWAFGRPGGVGTSPEIERLEINPLIVNRTGAIAVDARGASASC
jgi:succinyl-CoA synthetase beta subunit